MRFTERAYRTLPIRRLGDRVWVNSPWASTDSGATAFVHDVSETSDSYQLRYPGQWPFNFIRNINSFKWSSSVPMVRQPWLETTW